MIMSVFDTAAIERQDGDGGLRPATAAADAAGLGPEPLPVTYGRALVAYVFLYGFTQWTEEGFGLSPFHAGLVRILMFLVAIGVSIVSGRSRGVRGRLLVGALGQVAARRTRDQADHVRTLSAGAYDELFGKRFP
jgi:hypothetical protein